MNDIVSGIISQVSLVFYQISVYKKLEMSRFLKEWKKKSPKEKIYMGAGIFSILLAIIGVFLPIVPQVPFAILSAFLFSRGSPKLHRWIRMNKYFGRPVRDWEDHRVIRPKLKIFSTLAMVSGAIFGHWKLSSPYPLILDAVFTLSILFLLSRKSNRGD